MKDEQKSKAKLIEELAYLRKRVEELEKSKAERKQGEKMAREYAENIIDTVREPLLVLDASLRIISANRSFYRIFQVTPEQTEGQLLYDLGNRQWDIPRLRELLEEILPENTTVEDYEITHDFQDIGEKTMLLNARRIYREANKTEMILLAIEDITDRKQAELALQNAQEELIRKEKLFVLGQLAGGVGHELRNPLGAINNAVYFLNMTIEKPEPEVKETLEILEKDVATSERIISSLLDFTLPKSPALRKADLNEVVQEALSLADVPENVEVVTQIESLPTIIADPDQLERAFSNIILNGIQAMPQGGELIVKSETIIPDWVTISIADTGVGIPEENLGKLFEPLFTTKAKGIGLGLAIAKILVEGNSGIIEVRSEADKGSAFTVKLPLSRKEKR